MHGIKWLLLQRADQMLTSEIDGSLLCEKNRQKTPYRVVSIIMMGLSKVSQQQF